MRTPACAGEGDREAIQFMTASATTLERKTLCSEHTFHIPVMGTGFSIDTPLRVARFGIASVISLVDDILIEQVHAHHAAEAGIPFAPVPAGHPDPRAARITAYLNFIDSQVDKQIQVIRAEPFEPGRDITRYFELLPETPLKRLYRRMRQTTDAAERARIETELRSQIRPGSIDVNIMTKVDAPTRRDGETLPPEFNDGMSALRGYARSTVHSAIVFSAGLNQRLYSYIEQFSDFLADATGYLKKRIVLKVSDFRSAAIQGKYLAKRGLWVSEFRIESGLNCGGHAFATPGYVLGPIMEEFKQKRAELAESLHAVYNEARVARGLDPVAEPHPVRLTVQGGIGTASEQALLLKYYSADGTGWGTPFLLAPDVTRVDDELLDLLIHSAEGDVYLSDSSPLGVRFWNLRTSPSEEARRARIRAGRPGTPCPKGFLRNDTTFGDRPICQASADFQRRALAAIEQDSADPATKAARKEAVLGKSCICHELGGSVLRRLGIDASVPPAVCPGPNIVYFRRLTNLDELVGHIYGRLSVLCNRERPHMFIQELKLYVDHLCELIEKQSAGLLSRTPKQMEEFASNLMDGIRYYRALSRQVVEEHRERFLTDLAAMQCRLELLLRPVKAAGEPAA